MKPTVSPRRTPSACSPAARLLHPVCVLAEGDRHRVTAGAQGDVVALGGGGDLKRLAHVRASSAAGRKRAAPGLERLLIRYHYHAGAPRGALASAARMSAPERPYHADLAYYSERAAGLLASAQDNTETALLRFTRHGEPLTPDGARRVLAAEHGHGSWDELTARVAALPGSADPFLRAYRAIEDARPGRAGPSARRPSRGDRRARNQRQHAARPWPEQPGAVALSEPLLARGADLDAANAHGWTALHQAAYADHADLAGALLAAGADPDLPARGDGGTPLVVALFWGHRRTAKLLAEASTAPDNLRVAAGLGDTGRIDRLNANPAARAEAGAHRGFYRPHSGFPPWTPGRTHQEVLDEALAWAARNRRRAALTALTGHGARLEADVYRGTAAGVGGVQRRRRHDPRLIALGADPNGRSSFGGPDHGRELTALHLAAQGGRLEVIEALLQAGADPALKDAIYDSTPAGWAREFGQTQAEALLRPAPA